MAGYWRGSGRQKKLRVRYQRRRVTPGEEEGSEERAGDAVKEDGSEEKAGDVVKEDGSEEEDVADYEQDASRVSVEVDESLKKVQRHLRL